MRSPARAARRRPRAAIARAAAPLRPSMPRATRSRAACAARSRAAASPMSDDGFRARRIAVAESRRSRCPSRAARDQDDRPVERAQRRDRPTPGLVDFRIVDVEDAVEFGDRFRAGAAAARNVRSPTATAARSSPRPAPPASPPSRCRRCARRAAGSRSRAMISTGRGSPVERRVHDRLLVAHVERRACRAASRANQSARAWMRVLPLARAAPRCAGRRGCRRTYRPALDWRRCGTSLPHIRPSSGSGRGGPA